MYTSELKAGDWVMFGLVPVKIVEVHNILGELTVADISSVFDTPASEVTPMFLDESILKNNRWIRNNNDIFTKAGCSYIEIYHCNKYKLHEFGVNIGDRCMIIISCVHELQHILWGLGLNDDLKV